jgi:hypothetical protein
MTCGRLWVNSLLRIVLLDMRQSAIRIHFVKLLMPSSQTCQLKAHRVAGEGIEVLEM